MKLTVLPNAKNVKGMLLTLVLFYELIRSTRVKELTQRIAAGEKELKKELPVVVWQAELEGHERRNANATSNGMFMVDFDNMEQPPADYYREHIEPHREEWGIWVAHVTPSGKGLRLVAQCREGFATIAENQQWLASLVGLEHDASCKDLARGSFLPAEENFLYLDERIFNPEVTAPVILPAPSSLSRTAKPHAAASSAVTQPSAAADNLQTTYRGIPLSDIVQALLERMGGLPAEGNRNNTYYGIALKVRYITDFKPEPIALALPDVGLDGAEVLSLCKSACEASRGGNIPDDLSAVLATLSQPAEAETASTALADVQKLPQCPPGIKQLVDNAPSDFKAAVLMSLLPLMGTLGSRLRGVYQGKVQSPSFHVIVSAPFASGKSFMTDLTDIVLQRVVERDEVERAREKEYHAREKKLRLANAKLTQQKLTELLGEEPHGVVRKLPPTASITKLLMRMEAAAQLHIIAQTEEISTVTRSYKKDFANLSEVLRHAFENSSFGQEYASENSFCGILPIYYNTLFSGTPQAIKRFLPDTEDGTVSRMILAVLPDQFGKRKPVFHWNDMPAEQHAVLDRQLERLDGLCWQGDAIQGEHFVDIPWLSNSMLKWFEQQQARAVETNDRDRDAYGRRCAVVGFRAGMLAFFLWGEEDTPAIRKKVVRFGQWVANYMLKSLLVHFPMNAVNNAIFAQRVYDCLPELFTAEELQQELRNQCMATDYHQVVSRWVRAGRATPDRRYNATCWTKSKG